MRRYREWKQEVADGKYQPEPQRVILETPIRISSPKREEQLAREEVRRIAGLTAAGEIEAVEIVAPGSPVANYAFDVTPARYVTGLITEVGVIAPTREAIARAFPARAKAAA